MAASDGHSRRLIGVSGAVLVHLLLIGFILSGLPKFTSAPRTVRELLLVLVPQPQPQKKASPRDTAVQPAIHFPIYSPQVGSRSVPATKKLSIPLFDCAPDGFGRLSPEDQAKCAGTSVVPPDAAMVELRSHVRDPARRAAELAARRTPLRVSCTHSETQVIQNIVQQHSIIVDPLCAAGLLLRAARR